LPPTPLGPAWIIPTGGGSLVVGAFDGFHRWFGSQSGHQFRLPRLHAVQNEGCAPIVMAMERGLDEPPPIVRRPTVTGGIEVERPPRGRDILAAIRKTGGSAIAVDDGSVLDERRRLATVEGLDVEPTTAAAFAGLAALARRGTIARGESVVIAATGAGWKEPG
jgi:threonine synthase